MRLSPIIVLVAFSLLPPALGQRSRNRSKADKWEVSMLAGWTSVGDKSFVTSIDGNSTQRVGVDFNSGGSFALSVTDNFSRFVGAELEYAFSAHDSVFSDLSPQVPRLEVDQKLHRLSYSGVIYPVSRHGRIRPFGIVGAGASYFQASTPQESLALSNGIDLKDSWKFTFNWGGGVKFVLNRKWALRGDIRNYMATVPEYGLPRQASVVNGVSGVGFRPDGQFSSWFIGAGFTYFVTAR